MPWQFNYLSDRKILYAEIFGNMDAPDFLLLCKETLDQGAQHRTHSYLLDHTRLTKQLSMDDLMQLPGKLEKAGLTKQDKIAILYSKYALDFSVYEQASREMGFSVAVFYDKTEALKWLQREVKID